MDVVVFLGIVLGAVIIYNVFKSRADAKKTGKGGGGSDPNKPPKREL